MQNFTEIYDPGVDWQLDNHHQQSRRANGTGMRWGKRYFATPFARITLDLVLQNAN